MRKNYLLKIFLSGLFILFYSYAICQVNENLNSSKDTIYLKPEDTLFIRSMDTTLRIKNFTPYFTLHVDSTLDYQFEINKPPYQYYWFLKNSPVGLKINKDNGLLHFKAEKSYFLSGKLKYDNEYKVMVGVQNLDDAKDKIDTTFTILFYNTDIIPSRIKPTVNNDLSIEEGDTLNFKLQCETGSFPLESMTYVCNYPIRSITNVSHCGDEFTWIVPYDFIKEDEKIEVKNVILKFIGSDKFFNRDTAVVSVKVKQAINYPRRLEEYNKISLAIKKYIVQLKNTFRQLDRKIKHTKNTRTTFELTSASTALGGTIFSSLPSTSQQSTGKILPSVGVALVPVKEAVAPNKNYDQNSASLVRSDIQRLQYLLTNNTLIGDKDPDIVKKTAKLSDELQQVQIQLIDVPLADEPADAEELEKYFNDPKVNKKYRLKEK